MRYRKLRIAWSVVCGIACVLLILLWVRSYQRLDWGEWKCAHHRYVRAHSLDGRIAISFGFDGPRTNLLLYQSTHPWDYVHDSIERYNGILFPHWFLIGIVSGFGGLPWIRCSNRFSLRTLIFIVTLVAFFLGTTVWLNR